MRSSDTCWCATIAQRALGRVGGLGDRVDRRHLEREVGPAHAGELGGEHEQVGPCGSGGSAHVKLSGKWKSSGGSSSSAELDHRVLEAEQHARVDLEREVEVDGALAALLRVQVDLPRLAQRVALDEVPLVVHVEAVLDGVVLQVGHEPRDVDDGHVSPGHSDSRLVDAERRPARRTERAAPVRDRVLLLGVISANVRPSPSSGTKTGS